MAVRLERRFDELARATATRGHSRRGLLKLGAALATSAAAATAPGRALGAGAPQDVCARWCNEHLPPGPARGDCVSQAAKRQGPCYVCGPAAPSGTTAVFVNGACCTPKTCAQLGKNCGSVSDGCGGTLQCGTCGPSTACTNVACVSGVCTTTPRANGMPCDDGNPCTIGDVCSNGVCVAGPAVVCAPADACHLAGGCNPATGVCSNPPAPDGTPCTGGTCRSGICQPNPCVPQTCAQHPGACGVFDDTCGGHVSCSCAANETCSNGVCVPVTTDQCAGKANGTACDDGNPCTRNDTCQNGVCVSGSPVVCAPADACHAAGVCDPHTGTCTNPPLADGVPCGGLCAIGATCQNGVCVGGIPMTCTALDQCHVSGTCDPTTGTCSNPPVSNGTSCVTGAGAGTCQNGVCTPNPTCTPKTCSDFGGRCGAFDDGCGALISCSCPSGQACQGGVCVAITSNQCSGKPDGTPCDDGNACTMSDACQSGVCVSGPPVVCGAADQCHAAGVCDPATGTCTGPPLGDGTPCTRPCVTNATCQSGVCSGGTPISCRRVDECHGAGTCDNANGICSSPTLPDGTPCTGGTCVAGVCTPTTTCVPQTCAQRPGECGVFSDGCTATIICGCPSGQTCQSGSCVPSTIDPQQCVGRSDGTACDDGNACTTNSVCIAGVCVGGIPIACTALDQCHASGFCNPTLGFCTNPPVPNGTVCTTGAGPGFCQNGVCVG